MNTTPTTAQGKVAPQKTSDTPSPAGARAVGQDSTSLGLATAATAKLQGNRPDAPLNERTARTILSEIQACSKSVGIGGFFRALWDLISNPSTKSMDQARLNVAAKDYLKANPGEVDGILREIATNTPSQDPKIVQAFVAALKGVNPKESMIEFSQPALALHSLAQKLPPDQITPDLIGFCNGFPEQAQALAERQDLQRTSFQGTNYDDGMVVVCHDPYYKPEILNLIDAGLFEGEGREARIESFLKDPVVKGNQLFKDLHRGGMPHATLPNGVEILSSFGEDRSEYREMTGKPFDKAEYLKYILDKFKEAYGNTDEAAKAFKVFVQNFSGSGNTVGNIMDRLAKEETTCPGDYFQRLAVVNEMFRCCLQQPTMRMDKNFNITLNINACLSGEKVNEINQHLVEGGDETINENIMIGATVSTYIPAVISDSMDQRGQHGKQTTTFGVIASFGNGDSK